MTGYSAQQVRAARSFLFVPGDRPDRFAKAAAAGADVVVVDLEDAVSPAAKTAAREHVREWLGAGNIAMVRINGADTDWHDDDRVMVLETGAAVLLPKAENADVLAVFGLDAVVVALVETAAGISRLAEVCGSPNVHRVAFGSVDLGAQLGVDPTDREALLTARSQLVIASAAAGLAAPVDGVTVVLTDGQQIVDDVTYAKRLGFTAKLCIHPSQVPSVHQTLAPTADQIAWAQEVVEQADPDGGASSVGGQLVDLPVLLRARNILEVAQRI